MTDLEPEHPLHQTRIARWGIFEVLTVLATTFDRLNIAEVKAKKLGVRSPLPFKVNNQANSERTIAFARYAHECGDIATLELMLEDMQDLWRKYQVRRSEPTFSVIENVVDQKSINQTNSGAFQAALALTGSNDLAWPTVRIGPNFPERIDCMNDDVYETCEVKGQRIFRRIIPKEVSSTLRSPQRQLLTHNRHARYALVELELP
jgi:hypothetical protein